MEHITEGRGGLPVLVALADDHQLLRESVIPHIEDTGDIKVIINAANGRELVEAIELAPLELNADTVLAITFQATDRARRLRGIGQWVIIPDAGGKTACLLINSKPEGISIALTGKQRQSDLFHSIIQPQRNSKWIGIATIDLAGRNTWLSGIRCRMEPLRDSKGRITQLTVIKTISSSAAIQPLMQDPIAGHLIHQGYYAIDALHIASTTQYPEGLPYEWENHISQVVMTGQHIAEVLLTHSQVL